MLILRDWDTSFADRIIHYTQTSSTNSDAFFAADNDASTGTWIVADQQITGKGRSGRTWVSILGNLHASMLLRNVQKPSKIPELSIVAGVAFHQALTETCGHTIKEQFEIKWPNDILLNRCKLGGILIESSQHSQNQSANVVIGFGLNLRAHPDIVEQPATNLFQHGFNIKPLEFLTKLDRTLYRWIAIWSEEQGLSRIKDEWIERSLPVGTSLMTKGINGAIKGTFAGINNDGYLLLHIRHRELETVTFGDVSLETTASALKRIT